jgi:hypothetical protein
MAKVRRRTWTSGGTAKSAWIVDYFDQDGVRRQQTFKQKKAADAYLLQVGHEVKEGTHTAPSASLTVAQAAELWLKAAELNGLERGRSAKGSSRRPQPRPSRSRCPSVGP